MLQAFSGAQYRRFQGLVSRRSRGIGNLATGWMNANRHPHRPTRRARACTHPEEVVLQCHVWILGVFWGSNLRYRLLDRLQHRLRNLVWLFRGRRNEMVRL
jgi:hypothetical protein